MENVLHKLVGKEISDDFLQLLVDKKPTAMGIAMRAKDGDLMALPFLTDKIDLAGLKQITQGDMKDRFIMYWLTSSATKPTEEDCQPYILAKTAKGMPAILAMIEGNFPKVPESSHSPEYHVAMDRLAPMVARIYKFVKDDYDTLAKELDDMKAEIGQLIPDKGTVSLLLPNDMCVTISKSDTAKDLDFGWAADPIGYGQAKQLTGIAAMKAKMTGAVSSVAAPIINAGSKLIPAGSAPEKDLSRVSDDPYADIVLRFPPAHFVDKALSNWYKTTAGYVPNEVMPSGKRAWEERVGILDKKSQGIFKLIQQAKGEDTNYKAVTPEMLLAAKAKETGEPVKVPDKIAKEPTALEKLKSKVAAQPPAAKTESTGKSTVRESVPMISPEMREQIAKDWLKTAIDEDGIEMPLDIGKIRTEIKRHPVFSEIFGLKGVSQALPWKFSKLEALCTKWPHEAAVLMRELQLQLLLQFAIEASRAPKTGLDKLKEKIAM